MIKNNKRIALFLQSVLIVLVPFSMTYPTQVHSASGQSGFTQTARSVAAKNNLPNDLNIRLYANNENLILRFSDGQHAIFKPEKKQFSNRILKNTVHRDQNQGYIESLNKKRIWHSNQNIKVEFLGSYPISVSTPNTRLNLRYNKNELIDATVVSTRSVNTLDSKEQAIGQIRSALSNIEATACPEEGTEGEQCNDPDVPLPVGFNNVTANNELHINTRPADCHSYFTAYANIQRGTAIEAALADHSPYLGNESGAHSFPIADYWNNGNVHVLISRDLTANSYQPLLSPDGFYTQLIADGENIQENLIEPLAVSGQVSNTTHNETTTLHEDQVDIIYLDVVVQFGVITDQQRAQFNRAAEELLSRYGIIVRLVMIP